MSTLAVTVAVGEQHCRTAAWTAGEVRRLLGLETFVIGEEHLGRTVDTAKEFWRICSLRFSVFDLVPDHVDRVMYFDCDWRPVRAFDVDALFPDRNAIYAAPDRNWWSVVKRLEAEYGLAPGSYFNSGWMLLPRAARTLLELARDNYNAYPEQFGDQCVLNQVLAGKVMYAPKAFNVQDPEQWPDGANVMALHTRMNHQIGAGEMPDRQWELPDCEDPNEAIVRNFDTSHEDAPATKHLLELYQTAAGYAGGSALQIGCSFGHATLALALGGMAVTCYDQDRKSAPIRERLLERHGQTARSITRDWLHELDRGHAYEFVLVDVKEGLRQPELEALWMFKVKPGGTLFVHRSEQRGRLKAADAHESLDARGRVMARYGKRSSDRMERVRQQRVRTKIKPGETARHAYLLRMQHVDGWVGSTDAHVIDHLLQAQTALGAHGNALEIGVHHGKCFLILALGLAAGEHALAIDLFEERQAENIDDSGAGNRVIFEQHLARFAPHADVRIMPANSLELGEAFVQEHTGMRFVSIDEGHTRETTVNDMRLAEVLVQDGGIVAVDDLYHFWWSGVAAGMARYFWQGGRLIPFAYGPRKCYLTTSPAWAARYQEALRAFLRGEELHGRQLFEFDDVLLIPWVERFESDAWLVTEPTTGKAS